LDELCELLNLTPDELPLAPRRDVKFPLLVPREYVARMRPGDPADPLLLQVLPLVQEQERQPGFVADPVGDVPAALAPGVLQKYAGRVLVVTTGACAIHCRYCFRRNFDYDELPGFDEILWCSPTSDWSGSYARLRLYRTSRGCACIRGSRS
jgi:L-lysine 2,3-aminomutase